MRFYLNKENEIRIEFSKDRDTREQWSYLKKVLLALCKQINEETYKK